MKQYIKQTSNSNAQKHGLLTKQLIITQEESRPFNKLSRRLMSELDPETALETLLAEQIIISYWRLRRFLKLENEMFLFAGKPTMSIDQRDFIELFTNFMKSNPSFDLLSRYNASILRSFYRSINEYKNLKSIRKPNI